MDTGEHTHILVEISHMRVVACGFPQCSMAGPLLFQISINDFPNATNLFSVLSADDTSFQIFSEDPNVHVYKIYSELQEASDWLAANP